jgi:hypothetical protein
MHGGATIEIVDPSGDAQEPQPRRGWTRWLRLVLVLVALGGFGAFVAYVYYGMIRDAATPDGQIPLVRADATPFRSRPENPGGVEVPHQNFEVYDRLGQPTAPPQAGQGGRRQVERLLPPPEAPMPRPPAAPPAPPPAPVVGAPPAPAPAPASPPAVPSAPQPGAGARVGAPPAAQMPAPGAPAQPPAAPPAPAQAPAVTAPPAQVASAPPAAAGGAVRIQVGALPSQEAAAREAERLRRSYGSVFGRVGITVVPGESAGNPIYRIQAGPLRDRAAADELCSALRQHRVGCIIVGR